MQNNKDCSWAGGFFDAKGYFTFFMNNPQIVLINENPLAVTRFLEVMAKNDIHFRVSEKSKPSKSSKKKRWDLYLLKKNDIENFLNIMEPFIYGKNMQLQLMKNFYFDIDEMKKKLKRIISDYEDLMKYYNQSSHMLIYDENILFERIGWKPTVVQHYTVCDELSRVLYDRFDDLDYLSGILDANGTIEISQHAVKNSSMNKFIPIISFSSSNREIINRCCSTLKNNNIGHHIEFKVNEQYNKGRWQITISGEKRVKSLSSIIKDKLIVKNRQMHIIEKYCTVKTEDLVNENQFGASFRESIDALNKEN